jgi:hypothetical protein
MGFAIYKHYRKPIFYYFLLFYRHYMRTVIEIDRFVWGKVKDFATINYLSLNKAVQFLIVQALESNGYSIPLKEGS